MKAFLQKIVLAGLVLFTLAAISCKKTKDPKPSPLPKETTLSAVANPAVIEFGQGTIIAISSNGAVTLPNGTSVGATLAIPKIVRDTTISFTAKGEGGEKTIIVPLKVSYTVQTQKFATVWKLKEVWGFDRPTPEANYFIWKKLQDITKFLLKRYEYFLDGKYIERDPLSTDFYPDTGLPVYPITSTWKFETDAKGRLILNTSGRKEVIEFLPDGTLKLSTELTPTPTPDSPSLFRDTYVIYERANP